jgi:lysophospholipase L1-like esterase
MFIGDSFIDGLGVHYEDRATEILEKLDSTVITYNLGIGGYSTDQELLVLQKFGPTVDPDLVLWFFCLNDMPYNESEYAYGLSKPHYQLLGDSTIRLTNVPVPRRPLPVSTFFWLRDHSALGNVSYNMMSRSEAFMHWAFPNPIATRIGVPGIERPCSNFDSLLIYADSMQLGQTTYFLFKEVRDECQRQQWPLLLFLIPSNHCWTASHDETPPIMRKILKWCNELDLPVVDLFPVFRQQYLADEQKLYIYDNMHWNERGNELVAAKVLELVQQMADRTSRDE